MRNTPSIATIVLLILLCLIAPFFSASAEPQGVATVVALRGTVVAQGKSGIARNLNIKSQIFQEDVLKTDKNSQLQIMFTDSTIISLGRDSELKIAEYRWQPEQKDGALKTQVKEGVFRVMGGAIAKEAPQNFKTQTPTATIGIRGSMYAFKSTNDSLSVVFQGGKGIEVYNDLGKVTISAPGFGTRVVLNAPPARPSKFTEQDIKNLNSQFNGAAGSGNGTTDGGTSTGNGSSSGGGETGSTTSGGTTDNTTPPPTDAILSPPAVPAPPVLPPTNELPTAPAFTQPPPPPTDGIFAFEGTITGISKNPATGETIDTFTNGMKLGVNWHNRRIFGIAYDDTVQNGNPAFFFGSVNGSTISDITIFGSDKGGPNNDIGAIEGYGTGTFAGSAFDFFAFNASGSSYLVKDLNTTQAAVDAWTVAGGGQQMPGAMVQVAPTGSETWKGFVVGVSENMANPSLNRHLLYNTDPNNFNLTIDKDAGTINGAMTTNMNIGAAYQITGMTVGGAYGSVYLMDDMLAALLGGSSGITEKAYGNYMVVAKQGDQFSSYFTWGYWEVAHNDPADSTIARHIHVPYSMWLAGKPTDLQPLSSYSGTYTGGVRGTQIVGTVATQLEGTISIPVNFSNNSIGAGGSIAFVNGPTLNIAATGTGAIVFPGGFGAGNSFSTLITGAYTSEVHGAFYGPKAEAVGGNFQAEMTMGGTRYLGIFGGNR